MKNLKPIFIGGIVVILIILGVVFIKGNSETGQYDDFAECLTNNGVKMYGAFWCPHCQDQKAIFGKSQKLLPYIECSTPDGRGQTAECREKGIDGYPTWEFVDGGREAGVLSLEQLSKKTGCQLPKDL